MKKTLLVIFTISAAVTVMGQDASVTPAGEGQPITHFSITYDGGRKYETSIWNATYNTASDVWGDCSPEVVDNISGKKCLRLTCTADQKEFKMSLPHNDIGGDKFNLFGRRRISLWYKPGGNWGAHNVVLKIGRDADPANNIEAFNLQLGAWYDPAKAVDDDGWKKLFFNFRPYDVDDPSHDRMQDDPVFLTLKPRGGVTGETESAAGDIFYITDIKVEDEPYADGLAFNEWAKPINDLIPLTWNTGDSHYHKYPQTGNNGVVYLSGSWLKGDNVVNPQLEAYDPDNPGDAVIEDDGRISNRRWIYNYNEYRDLSWFVDPATIKYYVFQNGSYLRWPDRGGLLGTNTPVEVTAGYPVKFIANRNVLIFAEKPTVISDDTPSWYDTNVVEYQGEDVWEARDLELADDYSFVNPIPFTVKEKIMMNRSMTEGFNTIIYPFSLTAEEIRSSRVGTFYHHNADDIVYFIPTDATEANVPFVTENFSPLFEEGGINVTNVFQQFEGERTISACSDTEVYRQLSANQEGLDYHSWSLDDANYNLVGTYHRISGEGKWGIATTGTYGNSNYQQKFKKGGSSSSFKPFRAYLDIPESQGAAKFASLSISDFIDDSAITSISHNVVILPSEKQDVYTLSGTLIYKAATAQELINLPKGIYIINGKKQFVH